jgi:hypothetical protein
VSTLERVSVSRLTLLPSSRGGLERLGDRRGDRAVALLHRLGEGVLELHALRLVVGRVDVGDVVGDGALAHRETV